MTGAAPPVLPDERGRFGSFGGRYVPEVLIPALKDVVEYVDVSGRRIVVREVPGLTAP